MPGDDTYRHIFAPNAAFDARVSGVMSSRRTPRRNLNLPTLRPCVTGAARIVAALWIVKSVAVLSVGATAYDARIAPLSEGALPQRAAAVVLGRDPLVRSVVEADLRLSDAMRRVKAIF